MQVTLQKKFFISFSASNTAADATNLAKVFLFESGPLLTLLLMQVTLQKLFHLIQARF